MDAGRLEAGLALNLAAFRRGLDAASRQARQFGRDFQNSFRDSQRAIDQVNRSINSTGQNLRDFERIAGGIMLSQAFYGLKSAIQDGAAELVNFMNEMEKAQIALEYFLATPKEASSFLNQMNDFAATTSFNTTQALTLSRKLMAAQFNPNDVRGVMTILNDASAASGGTAEQMDRIVLALTQIKTNGKLAGQEMRQLAEAGIPIYKILQEQLGLTGEELMKVGKLGVKGDTAVAAVLKGLQERYEGAAKRIADTIPGMWETIKDDSKMLGSAIFQAPYQAAGKFLRMWRDTWEEARNLMTAGGLGAVLENMFPPSLHSSIRSIVGSIKSLAKSFLDFLKAIQPVAEVLAGSLTMALGAILPVLAGVSRAVAWLAQAAISTVPPLKYLLAAVVALLVTQVVSKVMLFFWGVLRIGMIAASVARAVMMLVTAVKALTLAMMRNPIIALVMVLAGALIYLATSSKTASAWLENLMDKLAALGGFDINKQLKPKDKDLIDVGGFESDLEKVGEAFEDTTDDMEDKAKKLKKYLMSFDEVFNIPEEDDKDKGKDKPGMEFPDFNFEIPDIEEEITDKLPREIELPKIKWPELPWWLLRPLNIKWNIEPIKWPEFPKFPGPPPAVVTLWETFLEGIRVKVKGLQVIFEGWKMPALPNWVLQPIPVPNLSPVLEPVLHWLTEWAGKFGHAWDGVWDPIRQPINIPIPNLGLDGVLKELQEWGKQLQERWGGLWNPLPKPILNVIPQLQGAWEGVKNVFSEGLSPAFQTLGSTVASGLGTVGSTIKTWAGTAWESMKQLGGDMVTNWGTSMESLSQAWSSFTTWFSSGWSTVITSAGQFASNVGEMIMTGISTAWEGIKSGFTSLGIWIGDHWKEIIAGIALVIIGAVAIFFAPISGAVAGAAGAVTVGVEAVIVAVGLALAGLAAVWDDGREAVIKWGKETGEAIGKWSEETWTTLKTWGEDTWETISTWTSDTAKDIEDWATNAGESFAKWTSETAGKVSGWASDVGTKISEVWTTGTTKFGELAETAITKFKSWTEDAGTKVSTFKENFGKWMSELPGKMKTGIQNIPQIFTGIMDKLPAPVRTALDKGLTFFKNLPTNIYTAITSIPQKFSSILEAVPKLVPQIITKIVSPFKDLPTKIWEAIKSIPEKIASVFSNIKLPSFSSGVEGVKSTFKSIGNIAGFANGGIIDKDSIVRVGEGGRREAIVPLDNATAMQPFVDAVTQGLRGQIPNPGTQGSGGNEDLRPLYVGTLIADDRGLKELERKMKIITDGEKRRGGGRE